MSHNHKKNNRRKPVCEELPVDQPQEQPEDLEEQTSQIIQSGSVTMTAAKHVIHCLTIVGQIEGHYILPPRTRPPSMSTSFRSWSPSNRTLPSKG